MNPFIHALFSLREKEPINPHYKEESSIKVVTLNILDENGNTPENLISLGMVGDQEYIGQIIYNEQWPISTTSNLIYIRTIGGQITTVPYYFRDGNGNIRWNFIEFWDSSIREEIQEGEVTLNLDFSEENAIIVEEIAVNPEASLDDNYKLKKVIVYDNEGNVFKPTLNNNFDAVEIITENDYFRFGWLKNKPLEFYIYLPDEETTINVDELGIEEKFTTQEISNLDIIELHPPRPFIITVDTTKSGGGTSTPDNEFTIVTDYYYNYNFNVKTEGQEFYNVYNSLTIQYDEPGIYDIEITGKFPRPVFYYYQNPDGVGLIEIKQWGDIKWESFKESFRESGIMKMPKNEVPNLENLTTLERAFQGIQMSKENWEGTIENWDVTNVQNAFWAFWASEVDVDLSNWNVVNMTNMNGMLNILGTYSYADNIYNAWSQLELQQDVILGIDGYYTEESEQARNKLINEFNWSINDLGKEES